MTAPAVSITNEVLVPSAPASAHDFLRQYRGAYTTADVNRQLHVVDWPVHLERLARSLRALRRDGPDMYTSLSQWLQARHTSFCDRCHVEHDCAHASVCARSASLVGQVLHVVSLAAA